MHRQAKLSTATVGKIYRQNPNEFGENSDGHLRRSFCDMFVENDKKFVVKGGRKNKLDQAKLVPTSSSQGKQTLIQLDRANFKEN